MASLASSSMFGDYMLEFNELMKSATSKIENGEDASLDIAGAKAALKSLQMEMRKLPSGERKMAKDDVNVCKKQLQSLERKSLMGTGKKKAKGSDSGETKDIKEKMSAATERSKRSKERLEQANRTLLETNITATDTMEELARNRETIESSIDKAKHTNAQMNVAESITYKMKHWWRNL
jgi:predicted  nucleic acid-binding Zn-ribbon protein|tara:strand:+ start:167 stop:703 length:537 start_codon:yes stop_codon:yes gene_type:complete